MEATPINSVIQLRDVSIENFYKALKQYSNGLDLLNESGLEVYVNFEGKRVLKLSKINIKETIHLTSFEGSIEIVDSNIGGLNIKSSIIKELKVNNSRIWQLFINKSEVKDLISLDSYIDELHFFENKNTDSFAINSTKNGMVFISNSPIYSISIHSATLRWLSIKQTTIHKFNLGQSNIIHFHFAVNTVSIKDEKRISDQIEDFRIRNCILGDFVFLKNEIKVSIEITDNTKILNLTINELAIKRINFRHCFIQNFSWQHDSLSIISFAYCKIENFNLHESILFKDSVFQIINTAIYYLKISRFVNTSTLIFSGIFPLKKYSRFITRTSENNQILPETNFFEVSEILHYELYSFDFQFETFQGEKPIIYLASSDLGKTSFINCQFDRFSRFYYYNSKMLEVFVSGTQFPDEIHIPDGSDVDTKNEQKRIAYGQFKKIYDNRGDNVSASEFLALELNSYKADLERKNIKWGERINLYLNKFSSDYGNDWVRAVFVTTGATLFCFWIYCLLLGYGIGDDSEKAFELLSFAPEFLNPLRKADFLKDNKGDYLIVPESSGIKGLARFWDYFSRIVIAYFVYQTIQAFRRFGKKS